LLLARKVFPCFPCLCFRVFYCQRPRLRRARK
jgi:hypothetical protein